MFFLEVSKTFEFLLCGGCGRGGGLVEEVGVRTGLWEERGGCFTSPGCRCEPLVSLES